MAKFDTPDTKESITEIGLNIRTWRLLLGLKAQQVAQRARISAATYNHLENGSGNISLIGLVSVLRALGLAQKVVDATNPHNSDLGRAKLTDQLPQRVKTNE